MWAFIWDLVILSVVEWVFEKSPRPVRIGCIVLLSAVVLGILVLVLWPHR